MSPIIVIVGLVGSFTSHSPVRWLSYWVLVATLDLILSQDILESNALVALTLALVLSASEAESAAAIVSIFATPVRDCLNGIIHYILQHRMQVIHWACTFLELLIHDAREETAHPTSPID